MRGMGTLAGTEALRRHSAMSYSRAVLASVAARLGGVATAVHSRTWKFTPATPSVGSSNLYNRVRAVVLVQEGAQGYLPASLDDPRLPSTHAPHVLANVRDWAECVRAVGGRDEHIPRQERAATPGITKCNGRNRWWSYLGGALPV